MEKDNSITKYFGANLARLLSEKLLKVDPSFPATVYIKSIQQQCENKSYTKRIELHARELRKFLPEEYKEALKILLKIMGDENPNETGMFSDYYWIMPLGKFVELFGLEDYDISIAAIEEITKRNTGEYAIRAYIRAFPDRTLKVMRNWALAKNFHLRRLASEGLRPKLPWATKLETFIKQPQVVFEILEILKEDEIKFVQKSVANNLTDYLKVNKEPTLVLLKRWQHSDNKNTQWIIKHATRKIKIS